MARFLFYACKVPSLLIAFGLFGIIKVIEKVVFII